jgi:hypothetical protein
MRNLHADFYGTAASERRARATADRAERMRAIYDQMGSRTSAPPAPAPAPAPAPVLDAPAAGRSSARRVAEQVDNMLTGNPFQAADNALDRWAAGGYGGLKNLGPQLHAFGKFAVPAAQFGLPLLNTGLSAVQGYGEGGLGGAGVQAASTLAGTLLLGAVPVVGPVLGPTVGAMAGSMAGSKINEFLTNAVDSHRYNLDTPEASIGKVIDPFFKGANERAAEQVARQEQDPAVLALRNEEQRRYNLESERQYQQMMLSMASTPAF